MSYFDVKTVTRQHLPDSIGARSINLMCAILESINYNRLYGGPFHYDPNNNPTNNQYIPKSPLDKIIRNIERLDTDLQRGATDDSYDVTPKLIGPRGAFSMIKAELERLGYPDIRLYNLFLTSPSSLPHQTAYEFIVNSLEDVHTPTSPAIDDQMYHFCVPFLTIQYGRVPTSGTIRPKRRPTDTEVELFLDALGELELQDIYDKPAGSYNHSRRIAARNALDCCILKEHGRANRPMVFEITTTDGNNKHCEPDTNGGNHCVSCGSPGHPDDWCNDFIVNGVSRCSLGSDYH